jgi:hypothetical protein
VDFLIAQGVHGGRVVEEGDEPAPLGRSRVWAAAVVAVPASRGRTVGDNRGVTRDSWLADRIAEFDRLRGSQIESWSGVEMALREETAECGPQFADPAVPCLHMLVLNVRLGGNTQATVHTCQDDDVWGLRLGESADSTTAEWTGIYRLRELSSLPIGEIDDVSVVIDEGVLAEVILCIRGRPVLLMAGEVYEAGRDRLRLVRLDESVLVFTDLSAAESADWHPQRLRLRGESEPFDDPW